MAISYELFMKHADKVCKNASATRPVLSGVKHIENGDAVCTDSHRLYVAKAIHSRTDGAVITSSGKNVEGNYPDVSRIIPDASYAKQTIQIEVAELLKAADMIASVGGLAEKEIVKGTENQPKPPALDFKEDRISYYKVHCKIHYSVNPIQFEEPLSANAFYVLDAMKLFKAAGCKTVTLNFFGKMRPFTFTNEEEDLLVLVLPIRKY